MNGNNSSYLNATKSVIPTQSVKRAVACWYPKKNVEIGNRLEDLFKKVLPAAIRQFEKLNHIKIPVKLNLGNSPGFDTYLSPAAIELKNCQEGYTQNEARVKGWFTKKSKADGCTPSQVYLISAGTYGEDAIEYMRNQKITYIKIPFITKTQKNSHLLAQFLFDTLLNILKTVYLNRPTSVLTYKRRPQNNRRRSKKKAHSHALILPLPVLFTPTRSFLSSFAAPFRDIGALVSSYLPALPSSHSPSRRRQQKNDNVILVPLLRALGLSGEDIFTVTDSIVYRKGKQEIKIWDGYERHAGRKRIG